MFDRNLPIISVATQEKIFNSRFLLIGCGLGSNIASLLARTGFQNFFLIDGDLVEDTNLNRQEFFQEEIGRNKAEVLATRIKKINPKIDVQISNKFLTENNELKKIAEWPDYIINTSDFSKGFFEFNILLSQKKKTIFCPFNVGTSSVVLVFDNSNLAIQHELNVSGLSDSQYFGLLLSKAKDYEVPESFLSIFALLQEGRIAYTPQLGLASNTTSAMIVYLTLESLSGKKINTFPLVNNINLNNV